MERANNVHRKYDVFIVYKEGIRRHVPNYSERMEKKEEWFHNSIGCPQKCVQTS